MKVNPIHLNYIYKPYKPLQTSGYTIRAFGCVIGAVLGAILYNTDEWGWG